MVARAAGAWINLSRVIVKQVTHGIGGRDHSFPGTRPSYDRRTVTNQREFHNQITRKYWFTLLISGRHISSSLSSLLIGGKCEGMNFARYNS
jgi:hypothetical protein